MATFDPWAQLRVLEVQALDTSSDQLKHRLNNLAERETFRKLASESDELRLREVAAITEAADRELDVAKAEADVAVVTERATKDRQLLDSGSISDSKQLTDLQHEVDSLTRRQADLEEVEIEEMQKLEDAQKYLASVRELIGANNEAKQQAEIALTVAVAEIEAELQSLAEKRAGEAAQVPADLLKLYEKLRTDNVGIGAARLYQGRCDGCRIELNPVAMAAARTAKPEELLRCEECRAILVRTAESGL